MDNEKLRLLDAIRSGNERGLNSYEIAHESGISPELVQRTARRHGIPVKIGKPHVVARKGSKPVAQQEDFGRSALVSLFKQAGEIPEPSPPKVTRRESRKITKASRPAAVQRRHSPGKKVEGYRRPDIDRLVTGGHSLVEIAKRTKPLRSDQVPYQSVHRYLKRTGQHGLWKENRPKATRARGGYKRGVREQRQKLVDTLAHYAIERAGEDSWALQKTVQRYLSVQRRNANVPLEKLFKMFSICEEAMSTGRRITYAELADASGFSINSVVFGNIMKSVGVEGDIKVHKKVRLSSQQKASIRDVYEIGLSMRDIAYFTDIFEETVALHVSTKPKGRNALVIFGTGSNREYLSYRMASEIYEAADAGFTDQELMEYFDGKSRCVGYALEHRDEIGYTLIRALDLLFPDVKHTRPYLEKQVA